MRRLTFLVVLVAFIFSCGGQWCVLQGIAWANMIREYSEIVSFPQAVTMTFSGQYPCAICKVIAEKRDSKNLNVVQIEKQEKKVATPSLFPAPSPFPLTTLRFLHRDQFLATRSEAPPTPPPRLA